MASERKELAHSPPGNDGVCGSIVEMKALPTGPKDHHRNRFKIHGVNQHAKSNFQLTGKVVGDLFRVQRGIHTH
jgi:hypothetical protein